MQPCSVVNGSPFQPTASRFDNNISFLGEESHLKDSNKESKNRGKIKKAKTEKERKHNKKQI